ncbi:hypothetical protein HWB90_gp080 [Mycobacterium phage Fowlmouth]|uniref:Uncharacterized protein n=1 Tax=Mycobacterium phage Fowlmouth TaxID=2419978 RepID=A0A3G2KGF1_9CAUD|nr:hypothetical protein HWB90_gp080 [Mycobacterium phage Fowlmouth]AYN58059.1 hypothetical protein SEA_FOWLMOUTH_110 [Mycobacterium phage Fowlmouth]
MSDFMNDLQSVINRHCQENQSGTPDFILASFVADSLKAFSVAVNDRERWYGRSQDQFGMPVDCSQITNPVGPQAYSPVTPNNDLKNQIDGVEEAEKTVGFKVITADYGTNVKTVGLLDHSTDEVAWMNDWLSKHLGMPRPYSLRVTEFDGFGTPNLFSAMIYGVHSGRVDRV